MNRQVDRIGSPERTNKHLDKIDNRGRILSHGKTMEFLIKDAGTIGYPYAKNKIRYVTHSIYKKKKKIPGRLKT